MWFKQRLLFFLGLNLLIAESAFAAAVSDPCASFIALLNRPSIADSACVVPYKHAVVELGYQYQNVKGGGQGYNLPEAQLRLGLPWDNELSFLLPNYVHQTVQPRAGFQASTLSLKHELGYNATWLGSVEGLLTLPSGSSAYGSNGLGAAFNGIVSYNINPWLGLTFMLGASTQTQPSAFGGGRYTSFNPDLVLSWQLSDRLGSYGEVYGQSKTGPSNGAGFNMDGGFIYLVTPKLSLDLEVGQRLSGKLSQFNNYLGCGLGILL